MLSTRKMPCFSSGLGFRASGLSLLSLLTLRRANFMESLPPSEVFLVKSLHFTAGLCSYSKSTWESAQEGREFMLGTKPSRACGSCCQRLRLQGVQMVLLPHHLRLILQSLSWGEHLRRP